MQINIGILANILFQLCQGSLRGREVASGKDGEFPVRCTFKFKHFAVSADLIHARISSRVRTKDNSGGY